MPPGLRCQASLYIATDIAHEVVDLLLVEPVFEGWHAVAAVGNLLGKLRVGVCQSMPFEKARNFQRLALNLPRPALALVLMTSRADIRVGCFRLRQFIRRGRWGGRFRRGGGRGLRAPGVGRLIRAR